MTRRLWILNHYAAGPNAATGTRHYDIGRELVRLGWDVTIFASSFDHWVHREMHLQPGETVKEETCGGVKFVWLRTPAYRGNGWRRVMNMLAYVIRVLPEGWRRERPDVVIGSSVHPFAAWAGYLLARHHKARFFFEVRDLWPQTLIDLGDLAPGHPAVRLLAWLERFLYARAEKILVLLPKADEYITGLGFPREKIVYLPNGVDLRRYEKPLPELPSEVGAVIDSLKEKLVVVYVGAHGMANHLDILLKAAKLLQERRNDTVHFLLVGDGPEKPRLNAIAESEGLVNVTFLPPIQKTYIPSLLDRCSVGALCLMPSPVFRYGVSSNKMFDYMAAGLPIAATGIEHANPVVESGCGVVLDGDDAVGLADVLEEWAKNPQKARELGQRGMDFVRERHSMQGLATSLDQLLTAKDESGSTGIPLASEDESSRYGECGRGDDLAVPHNHPE